MISFYLRRCKSCLQTSIFRYYRFVYCKGHFKSTVSYATNYLKPCVLREESAIRREVASGCSGSDVQSARALINRFATIIDHASCFYLRLWSLWWNKVFKSKRWKSVILVILWKWYVKANGLLLTSIIYCRKKNLSTSRDTNVIDNTRKVTNLDELLPQLSPNT